MAALFGRMGVLFLVIVAAVSAVAFTIAQDQIDNIYDGQLIIGANVLRALMSEELREEPEVGGRPELEVDDSALLSAEDRQAFNDYAEWRMFRIWRGPKLVLRSDTGPPVTSGPPAHEGFSDIDGPKERWRIYSLKVPGHEVTVQVGERTDIRLVLIRRIALGLALPLLLLIPLAAGLMWLSLNNGLTALRSLVAEIRRRTSRDLSPLRMEAWPRDLHPLVGSINHLFERIDRSLEQERQFLDNAAHQLRTPLAAVKLQAQMIAREKQQAERQVMTAQLVESVDRAAAMTESLLTIARLEARIGAGEQGDFRAETVAAIADLAPVAARKGVDLSFEGPDALPSGDPVLLRLIASNLLENAVHHAPPETEVSVRLSNGGGKARLVVADCGPGIQPEERERVLQRFYRGEMGAPNGSGLGLSIVSEAVRLLDGTLELADREDGRSGLCAIVELPSAAMA